MQQYDAAKDKRRKRGCSIRHIYLGTSGIIVATSLLTIFIIYGSSALLHFVKEPSIDFRVGDVCAQIRLIDHPVALPNEGSRLLVIVNIENMEQLGNALDQILILVDQLGKAELHVSLSINKTLDLAPPWVEMFQSLLKSKRIPFTYSYESEKPVLQPLWDNLYEATHVILIRNTFFCSEDILKLYWQIDESTSEKSKLACGVQFARTRERQLKLDFSEVTLRSLDINHEPGSHQAESSVLKNVLTGYTTEVACCWSNMVASSGSLLNSKPENTGDCFGYDCEKICQKSNGAKLVPSVSVVPDQATKSLIVVAPLHPHVHPLATPDL